METGNVWETLRTSLTPELTFLILAALALGIASLICQWIVTAHLFRESFGLGVAAIFFSPIAYVRGWMKVKEYRVRGVMILWTVFNAAGLAVLIWFMIDIIAMLNKALGTSTI